LNAQEGATRNVISSPEVVISQVSASWACRI